MDPECLEADTYPVVRLLVEGQTGAKIENISVVRSESSLEIVLPPEPRPTEGDYIGLVYDSHRMNEKPIATLRLTVYK